MAKKKRYEYVEREYDFREDKDFKRIKPIGPTKDRWKFNPNEYVDEDDLDDYGDMYDEDDR